MTDRIDTRSAVRTCQFSYSGNMVAYSTDRAMGQQCVINIVDVRTFSNQGEYDSVKQYQIQTLFSLIVVEIYQKYFN